MEKAKVIINEQHSLLEEQELILESWFGRDWEFFKVPSAGWNLKEMIDKVEELKGKTVVFCSPIPFLIRELSLDQETVVRLFHNDVREKKELPNGKIIYTVAKTGWQLI